MAELPFATPLRRPEFGDVEEMRAWVKGIMPFARRLSPADRKTYQKVRANLKSRDSWARRTTDPETGAAVRALHNAQTAANRPAAGSAQSDRARMLNTANKQKQRAGMYYKSAK